MSIKLVSWWMISMWDLLIYAIPGQEISAETCVGLLMEYKVNSVTKIFPILPADSMDQPYCFEATLSVTNTGFKEVRNWQAFIGFQHGEWLTQAKGVVLADGQQLPAEVGNGTTLLGFPRTVLKTAIATAGDLSEIKVSADLAGTAFGSKSPMPNSIRLVNHDGWECSNSVTNGDRMQTCCTEKNSTISLTPTISSLLPLESGDITILYDVMLTFPGDYWAQVTISNDNPIGRLDNWKLSWEWQQGEFIQTMKGAQTTKQDQSGCIKGPSGIYYQDFDFSKTMNCQRSPTIIDLSPDKFNDPHCGRIAHCCRNGTLLPGLMDPSKAKSVFQLHVYKIPPYKDRKHLVAPENWKIGSEFECGQPRAVRQTEYVDPRSPFQLRSAVSSWQITCNSTHPPLSKPKCCVSFSAYYNSSVIPCKTCACGCPKSDPQGCSSTAQALLLPPDALLLAFPNRTRKAVAWNGLNNIQGPDPLPCGDYCGVSVNWHIYSDYSYGWSARMSILNWNPHPITDWFAVVELDKAFPGYQQVYYFNATRMSILNNSIFVQGKPGLNNLSCGSAFASSPGKTQSILSFVKEDTPEINILAGDGFPSKVVFNGEECSLPGIIPSNAGHTIPLNFVAFLTSLLVVAFETLDSIEKHMFL